MAKLFLIVIGLGLMLVGILDLIPSLEWFQQPLWLAWIEIILGITLVLTSNPNQ